MNQLKRTQIAMVFVCVLSLAMGLAITAVAQEKPAKIHGTVLDSMGNPLNGAMVALRNSTTGQVVTLSADSGGRYRSGNCRPGAIRSISK